MNYSVLSRFVLICTFVTSICVCAPVDDPIITTTLSSSSLTLSSEKNELLADETSLSEENKENVVTEGSDNIELNPEETTPRIILEEDIAFFMPKTTVDTASSPETITKTTSSNEINGDATKN